MRRSQTGKNTRTSIKFASAIMIRPPVDVTSRQMHRLKTTKSRQNSLALATRMDLQIQYYRLAKRNCQYSFLDEYMYCAKLPRFE
jgi:hypothetical protein